MWEMYSFGAVPYKELDNAAVLMQIQGGLRLSRPKLCTQVVFESLVACWAATPAVRPGIDEILSCITENRAPTARETDMFDAVAQHLKKDRAPEESPYEFGEQASQPATAEAGDHDYEYQDVEKSQVHIQAQPSSAGMLTV